MANFTAGRSFNDELFATTVKSTLEDFGDGNFFVSNGNLVAQDGEIYSDYFVLTATVNGDGFEFTFAGDLTEPTPDNIEGTINYIDLQSESAGTAFYLSEFSIDFDQALLLLFSDPQVPHPLFTEIFSGDDLIQLSDGYDVFDGLAGNDTIDGGAGIDRISGGNGLDVLRTGGNTGGGEDGPDKAYGGEGDDVVYAHSGREFISGGDGIDTLSFAEILPGGGEDDPFGVTAALTEGVQQQVRIGHIVEVASIEVLVGSAGNDVLTGNGTANQLDGGEGDDTLDGAGGEDVLDGGSGYDVANFGLARADVAVTELENGLHAVSDQGGTTLTEIEKIQFTDGALVFDIDSENLSFAYRIYAAAYGRTPDEGGLRFWTDVLDDRGEGPPTDADKEYIASFFLTADEFVDLYGENPTNEEYINALYENVLHREADQAGYDFWLGVIASGQGKDDLLIWFTDSDENLANTAPDLDNGIWVL
jgi:Ca2+-binding RTX toxin-like protein